MDAIVKLVEMNSRNPWSQITSEKMFLSFLQGANVHNCAGFFVKSSEDNDSVTKKIITVLPNSVPISCLPTGAMKLSVDLDVEDSVLDVLRSDEGETNEGESYIDTLRLLILVCLRTEASVEEKLSMTFRKMEQKRGFGVTLEHVKEWIEDCEIVIGSEMKSYMRKERENGLMEERDANSNNNNNNNNNNKIERSASATRRKRMSLSLGELKKKEESTTHSLRWMRGKMEAHFQKYFKTHGVAMDFVAFTETVSEILEMWSTEALDSVERAFKETKSYDSFNEKIERAEALGGSGSSTTTSGGPGEHRRQNSGNKHLLLSGRSVGSSSGSNNKKLNRAPSIIETVAKTLKKGVESTVISREGSLREPSNSMSLTHHERALSDDRLSNLSNRSLPRSPTLSRQDSGSELIYAKQPISPTYSKDNLLSTAGVGGGGGGGGAFGMNPNTIVSYLPQQYRHVIDGAFDALGVSTKAHGGFATREGEHVNDNYYYEEDFEDDDADSAHMTEAQKRRRDLKSELFESEQEFIDVEKQQEGIFEDTTWKRLVAFFREVTIRLFLYNVVKLLLIIALLAGDAALCMFVVNRFGVVSGLGVVVIINLGFAGIFTYSMLKFQKREKGLRNMEFGHNWVRQTDHILQGNNTVVNSALKAAETAQKVESMKDKFVASPNANNTTNNKSSSQEQKQQQQHSPMKKKNDPVNKSRERFESAHEYL